MKKFPKDSRVVFLGDSITAACNFTTRISEFYITNFPELNVKFKNSGAAGGTLQSMIDFFEVDTLPFAPTHATVMLGVNDSIRWVLAQERTEERDAELLAALENFKNTLPKLLDLLASHNIEVTLITPAPYAEFAPDCAAALPGGHTLIYHYAEAVRAEAARRGLPVVDFHARMSELCMHKPIYLQDRVHPNDLGHHYMAEAVLRAQGFEYGEYRRVEEVLAVNEKIAEWNRTTEPVRLVYSAEWMIVKNFGASFEEKMEYMRDFIARKAWGRNLAFESIAKNYLLYKPQEAENVEKLTAIMENMYN